MMAAVSLPRFLSYLFFCSYLRLFILDFETSPRNLSRFPVADIRFRCSLRESCIHPTSSEERRGTKK